MSKQSEGVKKWRKKTKERLINSLGGKCSICGYNKCHEALEFHHLDPNIKEISLGSLRGNIKGWDSIIKEVRKCVLLCSNCHREVHFIEVKVPITAPKFNEDYADYRTFEQKTKLIEPCPICGAAKPQHNITCSHKCASTLTGKVDWDKHDIIKLYEKTPNFTLIGEQLGISGSAVRKRYMKVKMSIKKH